MARSLALAGAVTAVQLAGATTEQVHLALTGIDGQMSVSWVVKSSCSSANTVRFGSSENGLSGLSVASTNLFTYGMGTPICIYEAVMTNLTANTRYYYRPGDANTPLYSFMVPPPTGQLLPGGKPIIYGVLADFGLNNDVSLAQLLQEGEAGAFDVVLHAGDLAYDVNSYKGARGNDYMNAIAPMTALIPYMVAPGNHEHALNFTHYLARFPSNQRLADNSGSDNMKWYSFNHGLAHIVSITTEEYFYCNGSTAYCNAVIQSQLDWLQADLSAVDRAMTPWLIVMGHKQGWMDSIGAGNWSAIETILQANGADMYFTGHTHNYARTYPNNAGVVEQCYSADGSVYTDCASMVSIVVGSPGCDENISSGSPPADITAKLILEYGYGHLEVHNATHLFWSWEQTGSPTTAPTDAAARGLRGAGGSAAADMHGHIHRHGDRAPRHGKGAKASQHAPASRSRASLASAAAAGGATAVPILDSLWVIKNSH